MECRKKHLVRTISVKHDKRFMHIKSNFHCKIVSTGPSATRRVHKKHLIAAHHKKCVCTCDAHPTACYRKNFVLANNNELRGNVYFNIPSINKCSNLCTHHPHCVGWEYFVSKKSDMLVHGVRERTLSNNKCILKSGSAPTFALNKQKDVTTYAGINAKSTGCIQKTAVHACPAGKYKWIDVKTDYQYCKPCKGKGMVSLRTGALACHHMSGSHNRHLDKTTVTGIRVTRQTFASLTKDKSETTSYLSKPAQRGPWLPSKKP